MPFPRDTRKLNSEAEQYMKVLDGEVPLWVPRFGAMANPEIGRPAASTGLFSSAIPRGERRDDGKFTDMWGVTYVPTVETGGAALPEPNNFILDDIRKWRDIIKAPDLSDVDWEMQTKRDFDAVTERVGDISQYVVSFGTHVGYFQHLMNFMGFTNGLVAMYEEPDEVHALFEYLSDFYCGMYDNQLRYWGDMIDVVGITDDTATEKNPFVSPEMFRELVKPYHARLGKYAQDRGIHAMMHNCGRCEDSIDDWIDYGVDSWNPAQVSNDLDGIMEKYGNKMVLIGCWDSQGPVGWPHATEEMVREAVRETIMHYGKGGGFMFWGSVYGPIGDEETENKRRWMQEAYDAYREAPYK
ncbi:MAG: veratrol--corrinoid protein metyltransferase [Oscillospiraceae bacterium]|nr:veratrol--corrinoid protein metyltransferase [Oscillospiraceae bacterium]